MKEQNGIKLFAKGDALPPLPPGLSADIPVSSKFGFKVAETDGKAHWIAAGEEDYRAAEAQRLGIKKEDVSINRQCLMINPRECNAGLCGDGWCTLAFSPQGGYYYCTCA
jgi:hypothetical protein